MFPSFSEEKKLWRRGIEIVAGIDEVGRGSFAGPVVSSAVIFPKDTKLLKKIEKLGIDDSKRVKPDLRQSLSGEIKKYALVWDITEVGVGVINKVGIGKATQKAMRKTVGDIRKKLPRSKRLKNFFVLVDGFHVKYIPGVGLGRQKPVIKGDRKSISVAAASILAKVYRDRLMCQLAKKHSQYGWEQNKGYGTPKHQKAIVRYGLTAYHRHAFLETFFEKKGLASS